MDRRVSWLSSDAEAVINMDVGIDTSFYWRGRCFPFVDSPMVFYPKGVLFISLTCISDPRIVTLRLILTVSSFSVSLMDLMVPLRPVPDSIGSNGYVGGYGQDEESSPPMPVL